MNCETTPGEHPATVTPDVAGANLCAAIVSTDEYRAFIPAERVYNADARARDLLAVYQAAQNKTQLMRDPGSDGSDEERRLDEVRRLVESNPTLMNYLIAQDGLVGMLRELNDLISGKLNLDFAGLTKSKIGCCG